MNSVSSCVQAALCFLVGEEIFLTINPHICDIVSTYINVILGIHHIAVLHEYECKLSLISSIQALLTMEDIVHIAQL